MRARVQERNSGELKGQGIPDLRRIATKFESFALTVFLPGIFSSSLMDNAPYQKLLNKGHLALGAILTLGVFILMSILLRPFTFSPDPLIAQLQACFTAIPITAVFWFAYHMFMLVLIDQRKRK